jgi:hypothetical protein
VNFYPEGGPEMWESDPQARWISPEEAGLAEREQEILAADGAIWILGGWSGELRAGLWRFTPFPFRLFLPATQR